MTTLVAKVEHDSSRAARRRAFVRALVSVAPLLEYPTAGLPSAALQCRRHLAELSPEAEERLSPFILWTLNEPLDVLEERYTRTFDISAVCAPYAGVHIFGEESFARGELMARLRDAFDKLGFEAGPELPDHIAVLLRFAGRLDDDELDELIEYCLTPTVSVMAKRFDPLDNPYREPVAALNSLLAAVEPTGGRP